MVTVNVGSLISRGGEVAMQFHCGEKGEGEPRPRLGGEGVGRRVS